MVKRKEMNEESYNEDILKGQIPEYTDDNAVDSVEDVDTEEAVENPILGQKLGYMKKREEEKAEFKKNSGVGENIFQRAQIREGWLPVNREVLGERNIFYPADWEFKIKPATVEAIRNWSMVDEENPLTIDEVFNEILKNCLSISSDHGNIPWSEVNSWDRFTFVLLIREYTFANGEQKISYTEDCPNCGAAVEFNLVSTSLMFDMPDQSIIDKHYSDIDRMWVIDPEEYGMQDDVIELYLPTIEKDANIRAWMVAKYQENKNAKIDPVFLRFLPWMTKKISKNPTVAKKEIRDLELEFKMWDVDKFTFMDEILKNIIVTPARTLMTECPKCEEEVTSEIRFPNGVSSLFTVANKFKKFGTK